MNRVLSMGGRLQKLLKEAQAEAEQMVKEAREQAESLIDAAKIEADRRRLRAQRGSGLEEILADEEKIALKEAEKVKKDYEEQANELKKVQEEKVSEAINYALEEVLPK